MNTTKNSSSTNAKGQSHNKGTDKGKTSVTATGNKASSSKSSRNENADKTKAELLEMAKKMEITGRHDMTKDELIKAIDKHGKK
ncbi:Rho termination factor N-terminal domain-containing protein [Sphingobacterium sp. UBA1498]|uniref:Rho termination factor N-terminal domain-containing protein n=1 Tax=Sphingobacterium sp. UBA1498 TaxID=1947481 RepID=UPI0025ED28F7|nr:Rho termination factor N-terminal domain-containing protein [Sphingobacterium sp. UBA1498]